MLNFIKKLFGAQSPSPSPTHDPLSNQQIFDKVAVHLFTQGKQSENKSGTCLYRGRQNTSCAVGCLIPDSLYERDMEENIYEALYDSFPQIRTLFGSHSKDLLIELQLVHDVSGNWVITKKMHDALLAVADKFDLDASILDGLKFKDR